jgi:hypothetical protein
MWPLSHYPVIWFDPTIKAVQPSPEMMDVRFANDWVVSRSGWKENDGVVALRSGGPSNHEHADRNSVIFKVYGERLFHDPLHAAYSYTQPHWLLRQTEAHTAVLIGGKGHQYHDGHEGTNASWAEAKVLEFHPGRHQTVVTSEATDAYRLVNKDVKLVLRSVIFLKPDVLLLVDRVRLAATPLPAQLRFQVFNDDRKGVVTVNGTGFRINRPGATLEANSYGRTACVVRNATLNLPAENGVFPYAEVESESALEHLVLTVCTAQQAGKAHGTLSVQATGNGWKVNGSHNGRTINIAIETSTDIPKVALES